MFAGIFSICGLILGLGVRLIFRHNSIPGSLIPGSLNFGLWYGVVFGIVTGLGGGFTDRVKAGKASPNQGIMLSLRNSLTAFLVTWLTIGLIFALIVGLNRGGSQAANLWE